MPSDYDATEFVDADFQEHKTLTSTTPTAPPASAAGLVARAPTREEVDLQVTETQKKLAELKRAQEELERQRSALEETRRRQSEFQTGRQEMITHLTRGVALLEQAEFAARRDAEQMAKTISGFRDALGKVQMINDETWTKDNLNVELTRGLTAIENARMEWNTARLKFPILSGAAANPADPAAPERQAAESMFAAHRFTELCRIGLAITWPLAVVALLAVAALVALLLRR
jgi:hypothetical protein